MKELFKTKKAKVATRLFISLVAVATLIVSTMAWFAANHTNDAEGMDATVEVLGNLVIASSSSAITEIDTPIGHMKVSFDGTSTLRPARHNASCKVGDVCHLTDNTYLEYNSNPTAVSMTTGLAEGTEALVFSGVLKKDKDHYCVDYPVYIASTHTTINNQNLQVTISSTSTTRSHKARTVDFYVNGVYKGSRNIVNGSTPLTLYSGDIPYNKAATGDKYIEIIMRSYYDGGLEETSGKTYINTAEVDTTTANLAVKFEAVDK